MKMRQPIHISFYITNKHYTSVCASVNNNKRPILYLWGQ